MTFQNRLAAMLMLGIFVAAIVAAKDPGCEVPILVSTGGPVPTIRTRW